MATHQENPTGSRGRAKSRKTDFKLKEFVWELQDLLDIPREVRHTPAGNRYEYPAKAWEVIGAIVKVLVDALQREEKINIRGFGTFKVVNAPRKYVHKAFLGNTPDGKLIGQSPVPIKLPDRKIVVFKPSVHLQAMLNQDNPSWMHRRAMKTWKRV